MRNLALPVLALLLLAGCSSPPVEDDDSPAQPTQVERPAAASPDYQPTTQPPLAAPPAPGLPAVPDPTRLGSLPWERWTFELEPRVVDGGAIVSPYVVVPEGSIHAPKSGGPFPVVVLMHGRHGTCELAGLMEVLGPPCPEAPPAVDPVDSFAGYDPLAENLASHGYVVASLSANHVNDHDNDFGQATGDDFGATARARLALSFLDDLRAVAAGGGPEPLAALDGRVDLSRVGLMGHSRGGEGVARAATLNADWPEPHSLRAVFALAPTDFDRHVVLGVPLAVLLPYCDGDVSNLQGAWMYDDASTQDGAGPLHQVLALGANHNWYNSVWTGSDWGNRGDPHCDLDDSKSGRDEPKAQMEHGVAVMASFFRAYVGGETDLLPLLTGEVAFAQPGIVVSHHPPVSQRLDLAFGAGTGFTKREDCRGTDCPIERTYSKARQTFLSWEGAHALSASVSGLDASRFERLALRIGFQHDGQDTAGPVTATLVDGRGRSATVTMQGGVFSPPGDSDVGAKTTLNMAWAPLDAYRRAGLDLSDLAGISLSFGASGEAQVADLQLQDLI